MAYERRDFGGGAVATTLVSGINAAAASFAIVSATGWPDGSDGDFFVVLSPDTSAEEKVRCASRSGTTVTVQTSGRGSDGTSAATHAAGATVQHVFTALDADEANYTVQETVGKVTAAGEILVGDGANSLAAVDAKTSGRLLIGNGTTVASVAVSGDVTISSAGVTAIGASKVTNTMMADDAVDSPEIADGAIDLVHMSVNSVDSDQYVDGSIDTAHIGDLQVTTGKLAADAVDGTKLADDAVNSEHVADGAVDLVHMSANSVDSDQYVDGSIDTVHIAADQVTAAKHSPTLPLPHSRIERLKFTGTRTTTSSTFAPIATDNVAVVGFVKHRDDTFIQAEIAMGLYATGNGVDYELAVDIDGTDYVMTLGRSNAVSSVVEQASGFDEIPDIPAGTYTCTFQWRRANGLGTLTTDATLQASLKITETF